MLNVCFQAIASDTLHSNLEFKPTQLELSTAVKSTQ